MFLGVFNFIFVFFYLRVGCVFLVFLICVFLLCCLIGVFFFVGIIVKDFILLEEEIKEIRRSGSSKVLDNILEFEFFDIFYFCRKGMEIIMDDEVTKRFLVEELEFWNLLSRINYNF